MTPILLAVVVKKNEEPKLIKLGEVAPLRLAIDTWRKAFSVHPSAATVDLKTGNKAGLVIRRQIWEPLLTQIADAKTILVSADGVLGRLPLGALPGKKCRRIFN